MMTHKIVDSTTTSTSTSSNNTTSSGSQYAHQHFHLHPSSPPYSTTYPPPSSRTDPPHTSKRDQSIPALLNSDDDEHDYLPTPVTPAGAFSSILPLSEQLKHSTATTNTTTTTSANEAALTIPSPGVNSQASLQQYERNNKESSGGKSNNSKQGHANTNQPSATTEKVYACHECDQTFTRPHNLKSHLATHSSEKPYQVKCLEKGYKAHGSYH